jgi:hypothetical protein
MSESVVAGASERPRQACDAALGVAAALGIPARRAVVLADWNNTIVRLAPSPTVAKVGTSHLRDARLASLERELTIAAHLAAREAAVVPPAPDVPAGPHCWQGWAVTLWQYVEPVPALGLVPPDMATAITLVHEALSDFEEALASSWLSWMTPHACWHRIVRPRWSPPTAAFS